jgi:two-component system sensor histidine kinase and response regulator WspE
MGVDDSRKPIPRREEDVTAKPTCDASLLELFRAEMETHLPALNEGLLALERGDAEPRRLEGLMRAAHSVKGAARIVGLDQAVQLAHVLEDCFVAAQRGEVRLGSDAVDVLLRGVDGLQRIGVGIESDALPDEVLQELCEAMAAVRSGPSVGQVSHLPAAPRQVENLPHDIRPAGRLDAPLAEEVRGRLAAMMRRETSPITLDLAEVTDVDATGLVLLALAARVPGVRLANPAPPVRELMRLTRLDACSPAGGGGR